MSFLQLVFQKVSKNGEKLESKVVAKATAKMASRRSRIVDLLDRAMIHSWRCFPGTTDFGSAAPADFRARQVSAKSGFPTMHGESSSNHLWGIVSKPLKTIVFDGSPLTQNLDQEMDFDRGIATS
jgi:hypothetical protein